MLKLREGDSERGVPITPKVGRMRFDEGAADLITEYRNNDRKSLQHLRRRLRKHLTPVFGNRRMALITTADARDYIDSRQAAGASHGEINRELAILKRMYALALQGGKLLIRPHIPMLKEHNVRTGFFEREELDAMRAHLPAPLRPMAVFAYLTGWRVPSEVQTLEWRQVDFKAGTVRLEVGTTKNEAARIFPFDVLPELRDLLGEQATVTKALEQRQGQIVRRVFHRNGNPIKDFRRAWKTACEAAGCPGRIPHDLRRTAVRNLVRAGVSDKVAMELTGHKTRSVFDRYDIVNEADLREGVRKLGQMEKVTVSVTVPQFTKIRRLRRSS